MIRIEYLTALERIRHKQWRKKLILGFSFSSLSCVKIYSFDDVEWKKMSRSVKSFSVFHVRVWNNRLGRFHQGASGVVVGSLKRWGKDAHGCEHQGCEPRKRIEGSPRVRKRCGPDGEDGVARVDAPRCRQGMVVTFSPLCIGNCVWRWCYGTLLTRYGDTGKKCRGYGGRMRAKGMITTTEGRRRGQRASGFLSEGCKDWIVCIYLRSEPTARSIASID